MTDDIKDLLTLAAKACGYSLVWGEKFNVGGDLVDCTDMSYIKSDAPDELDVYWAPHIDDGDGARMETKLRIDVEHGSPLDNTLYVSASRCGIEMVCDPVRATEEFEDEQQRQAARRRASLRAAAEIGRGMP